MRELYTRAFALAILLVTLGASYAFSRIGAAPPPPPLPPFWSSEDSAPASAVAPIRPSLQDYEQYAASDAAWRSTHARTLTLSELSARGDWRTPERQALDDSVHALTRARQLTAGIALLERWLVDHPRDEEALLSLARLLSQTNRTDRAAARYRQLLALKR
jgi:thioredoxin-like negative regulator of GroEL